jgi:predicted site-specific integrase-resolvase
MRERGDKPTAIELPKLVGTAEAAELLGVERPRIARWLKAGVLPDPVQRLAATPIWTKDQIEEMRTEREARRKLRSVAPLEQS